MIQLHSGHREVKHVRTYNRFVDHAQFYKSIFFWDSKLVWPKQNQTKQVIPWGKEVTVQGTDGIQFQPNINGDESLYVVDPLLYRSLEYKKTKSETTDGLDINTYSIADSEYDNSQDNIASYYQN